MRNKMARDFCVECINQVLSDGTNSYIENPAIKFTEMAKNGDFDPLSEEEYTALLSEVKILAKLFNNRPRRAAGSILLDVLANAPRVSYKLKDDLADLFGRLLAGPGDEEIPPLSPETIQAIEDYVCEQTEEMLEDFEKRFDHIGEEMLRESLRMPPPKKIRDNITKKVIGQPEAVKAAAMIVYNHLSGRRTNAVFAGPSGCGKSEIWRTLSKEYPGLVRMIDFSRFAADGWRGSLHLRDIFNGVGSDDIRRRGLIVVLDEADKRLCEPAMGSGGTDYNVLLQNDLLKMMDGDVIEFGAEDRQPALSVDCSKVSVVMLGAFERLLGGKSQDAKRIGFGTAPRATAGGHKEISYDDLINGGMRREIAGRVNRIVALGPLSMDDYKSILMGPVLFDVRESFKRKVSIDPAAADALTGKAIGSGLGVRWMRSQVTNAVDDALFDEPEAEEYTVTMQDGKLLCRAQAGDEAALAKKSRRRRPKAQGNTPQTMQDSPA